VYRSVLAQVDAKMVRPESQRPFEGMITIHCELSPMASTEYEPGRYVCHIRIRSPSLNQSFSFLRRPSEEEVLLARMLDKIFRRSDAIDREALCIISGERVSIPSLIVTNRPTPSPPPLLP
jgi:exosome complex component RRP45